MRRLFRFYILIIALSGFSQLWGQGEILRGELPSDKYDFVYFIPAGKGGLITLAHEKKFKTNKDYWELWHYSVNLKKLCREEFHTGPGRRLMEYRDDGDSLLYCFFSLEKGGSFFEVMKYNYHTHRLEMSTEKGQDGIVFSFFDMAGDTRFAAGVRSPNAGAYFLQALYSLTLYPLFTGSRVYKITPGVMWSNSRTGQKGLNKPVEKGLSTIVAARANRQNNTFSLIIKTWHKRRYSLHFWQYNLDGKVISDAELTKLNGKNILSGQLINGRNGALLFIGTYNDDTRKGHQRSTEASGIFVSKIAGGKEAMVKFHPFYSFTNASNALGYRDKKRFEEGRRKGENIDLSFQLLLHRNIIQMDSTYVILAESYYPEYHYESNLYIYGGPMGEQVFDGFRFTDAITAAFDEQGNLLWDNVFAMDNVISYRLSENVIVYFDGKTQVMLYYQDGVIYSKVISGNKILYHKEENKVPTVDKNDEVRYESHGKIYHWYDNYFLLTGYQVVMNRHGKKRKVYFFVKLAFD